MKSLNSLYFKRSLFRYFSASSSVRQFDYTHPSLWENQAKILSLEYRIILMTYLSKLYIP